MEDKYPIYANDVARRPAAELAAERREQIALERAALQAEKDRCLAQQRSMETPPAMRIALWESRHGLALPRDPKHPLMRIIAANTDLDVTQVLAECERRAVLRVGH
jgi:hypothetical protein